MKLSVNAKLSLSLMAAATIFIVTAERLKTVPRQSVQVEMQVALPLFVQVFMVGGDRFLAANISAIRALVVDNFKMKPEEFAILAKVQQDVSWLNPGHEDNYYVATAILPWRGEFEATQLILARATKARPFDFQPAFHYAFNLLHFTGDAVGASAWLREAAEHLPEGDERLQMQNLAAIWMDKAQDVELAIRVIEAMAKQAKRRDFQRYLDMRVARLRALQNLRKADATFRLRFGRTPNGLQELIDSGLIAALPADPFGFGFDIDSQGRIVLRNSPPKKPKPMPQAK